MYLPVCELNSDRTTSYCSSAKKAFSSLRRALRWSTARPTLRRGPSRGCMMYTQIVTDQPTQKTPHGQEIPVPKREDFLRNLKKAARPKPSTPRRRPKKERL